MVGIFGEFVHIKLTAFLNFRLNKYDYIERYYNYKHADLNSLYQSLGAVD